MIERPYLEAGYRFPEWEVTRTKEHQAERLRSSDVDPALYGEYQETALSGVDGFRTMTLGGMPIDGYVHTEQRFRQRGRIRLGETLTVRGRVESVGGHPRGTRVHHVYEFVRPDGSVPLVSEIIGLLPDAAMKPGPGGDRSPGKRGGEDPTAGLLLLARKTLTPGTVNVFSRDVGNEIHFDPAYAARYGFRAPLAQGLMSAVWMMSALARRGVPETLDVFIRFIRPVFWDDDQSLWARPAGKGKGDYDVVRSVNPEGKTSAEMTVESVSYPA
jgi:acyl dehydratase